MLPLIQIKYIHQCENTDHVYAIVRTSLGRPTWSVRGPKKYLYSNHCKSVFHFYVHNQGQFSKTVSKNKSMHSLIN